MAEELGVKLIELKCLCQQQAITSYIEKGIIFTSSTEREVMDTINDLVDLLMYQARNLYSAEELMEQAYPSIIEKVSHPSLVKALQHHAGLSAVQKQRLTEIMGLIQEKRNAALIQDSGLVTEPKTSKGMKGLIEEMNELLALNLPDEVKDSAIIAAVQSVEHYEICAYGTAHAFADQLHLHEVAALLNETLQEEYDADDLLTSLATAAFNKKAVPQNMQTEEVKPDSEDATEGDPEIKQAATVSISERTVNSPGGRAGTSHRRYGTGESRGH